MVRRLEKGEQLSQVKMDELYIWMQVYDLPVGFNSEIVLKSIGNYAGKFIMFDPKNFQSIWKPFLRIKVAINVNKPLKSQMRVKKSGGEWSWITFKYERLPTFCFYCGIIGHSEKFCEALFDDVDNDGTRKYDASLRATMRTQIATSKNQWLRSADGGKLMSRKTGGDDAADRYGQTESADLLVTRSQDYRNQQEDRTEKEGMIVGGGIRAHIKKFQNEEIAVITQKRPRIHDNGLDEILVMGCTKETEERDVNMIDGLEQNQKNLALTGPVVQARPPQ